MRAICLIVALSTLGGCQAALSQEEAMLLAPANLCSRYNLWSLRLEYPAASTGYSRESVIARIKVLKAAVESRSIECPTETHGRNPSRVVNCFPNEVTGGVTCV